MEALTGSGCGHSARHRDFVCVPAEGVGGSDCRDLEVLVENKAPDLDYR